MTLSAGSRLGPYEILSPLGAGGMGEVYRARDIRLGREVAIKVLPEAFASDPERLRRFEGEARAASALSDPHIVTVFDVGAERGINWFASELVEGTDLRALLGGDPIPIRRTIDLAEQMASGLAAAHERGIVHRDLKPENVLIAKSGLAKIADFGLAKVATSHSGSLSELPTSDGHSTAAGVVMGTIAYMSPEQARGADLDFRSDQFAFGAILCEMLTGKTTFHRGNAAETMAAILREDPAPLPPSVPAPLRWIAERCLTRDREGRYGATSDLRRDLRNLREHWSEAVSTGTVAAASEPRKTAAARRSLLFPAALVAAAFATAAALFLALRSAPPPPIYQQLTFRRGDVVRARFAPDGQTILYSASWDGKDAKIFLTRTNDRDSTPLALPDAAVHAISPSGKMAIGIGVGGNTLAETSLAAGAPRPLAEKVDYADYQPGTEKLAISRDGRIEFPVGKVLYDPGPGARAMNVCFSPKGDRIAFREDRAGSSSVCLVDLSGHKKVLTSGWSDLIGMAWNPVRNEIWFTAREGPKAGVLVLHAVSLSGRQRLVASAPGILVVKDIAPDGRVLLARWDVRISAIFQSSGGPPRDLSWYGFSTPKALSPDGKTMLLDEDDVVYVRPTDGVSPAVRLGEGIAQDLSPDGRWALALPVSSPDHVLLFPTGPGEPRSLDTGGIMCQYALFLPDGKRLVVAGTKKGERLRLYVLPISGGAPLAVSPEGGGLATRVPPDGRRIAGWAPPHVFNLYPVDGSSPARSIPGIAEDENPQGWDSTGRFLYLVKGTKIVRFDVVSGRKEPWMDIADTAEGGVVVSDSVQITPDGRFCAYARFHSTSDLYLVTGLR
jgi:hypothetical protein